MYGVRLLAGAGVHRTSHIVHLINLADQFTIMLRKTIVTTIIICCAISFSFFTEGPATPAERVKTFYKQQATEFELQLTLLQELIPRGNVKALQQQFQKARLAYKQIETLVTYYFDFAAVKLNGPPIPFYEEEEPDMGVQQPAGMQVIAGLIYPAYKLSNKKQLSEAVENLISDTRTMQQTKESFAFNDEYIFDALMEELYRITAMGLSGFDSPEPSNALIECRFALEGVKKILTFYENDLNATLDLKKPELFKMLELAQAYLSKNNNFNAFNRMEFITNYLDTITKLVGYFKKLRGFADNKSGMYYSTIRKDKSLFSIDAFDPNKYLDDNTTTPDKIEMGRQLFFDPMLSVDGKRSCATCHDPSKAFTDGLKVSVALDGHSPLTRNSPTLINASLQRSLFLDGRSVSLEDQVLQVLNNAKEMHGSAEDVAKSIVAQQKYRSVYATAYTSASPDAAAKNICNAIACYERTLVAINSKFDRHMRGQRVLNADEINGFNIFMGKAKCGTCHFAPLFSGSKPPRYYYSESEVIGVPLMNKPSGNILDPDPGRFAATNIPIHKFAFKTPGLRNIALTAPYMHNGSFKTLEDVVEFYNKGGGKGMHIAPENQTLPFEKLNLTAKEKRNIVLF